MKNFLSLLFFSLTPFLLLGQLVDDFSDGDFTTSPTWSGDIDRYIVNVDGELQLNHTEATGNSVSYLSLPANTAGLSTWEFSVRLDFSPSTSNFARVYLNSSIADLTGDVNGYYVKIGGISGTDDAVELWRQDGSNDELLITGTPGGAGSEPVDIRIRVERDADANWVLLADYTGGTDFISEGGANDATYDFGAYFGYWNAYTSTRSDKFFLDNIVIDPLFVDTQAPTLLSAEAVTNTQVNLQFDEPIADFEIGDFAINNNISVTNVVADPVNPVQLNLTVSPALQNFQTYTLTVQNVSDAEGNILVEGMANFDFLQAQAAVAGDIIITEIMADPTPEIALPDAEFVEIFNKSDKVIDLSTLFFVSDSSPDMISGGLLLPNEYIIICDDDDADALSNFGNVATVSTFPALTNGGDFAGIQLGDGTEIDAVNFSDDWYQDPIKQLGGWTLERIDNETATACAGNWRASLNSMGGTPGSENSVQGQFLNLEAPRVTSVVALDEFLIQLNFSAEPDAQEAGEEVNYSIDNGAEILSASLQADNKSVLITLTEELQNGVLYTITISNAIGDCLGNMLTDDQTKSFGLAEEAEFGDVIINEILFNPRTGGADYVEFYNRSNKIINFFFPPSAVVQMFPDDYVVISEKPDTILSRFNVENPDNLFEADLPSLPDAVGVYSLFSDSNVLLDVFTYSETQHYELLRDEDGVALERIDPNGPTNEDGNWHSAAATVGYGTPTAINSQLVISDSITNADFFQIENPRVSPDEDGFEDVMQIRYAFDQQGYSANIKIYDAQGRQIKELLNNQLLGTSGSLKWDGSTDAKSKARLGIYVFWAEVFRPDGTVAMQKEAIVVAGNFE